MAMDVDGMVLSIDRSVKAAITKRGGKILLLEFVEGHQLTMMAA